MSLALPPVPAPQPAGPAEPPPSGPGAFALALAGAKRRWFLAALFGTLLGAGAAAAYYLNTPPKFTVTAVLQVSARSFLVEQHDSQKAESDYRRRQAAQVRNRDVIMKALESKKVSESALLRNQPDPAAFLESEIKATAYDGGQIRVSLTGEHPTEVADVLNAVLTAYKVLVVDAEVTERNHQLAECNKLIATTDSALRALQDQLGQLAKTLQTSDTQRLSLQQQLMVQQYTALMTEYQKVQSEARALRNQLEIDRGDLEAVKARPVPPRALADALALDPSVRDANAVLDRARAELDNASKTTQPGTRAYDILVANHKAAEERVETAKKNRTPAVEARVREEQTRELGNKVAVAENRARILERQQAELKVEVEKAQAAAERIGIGSVDIERLKFEIADQQAIMTKYRAERTRLQMEEQTYRPRVRVGTADAGAARPAASAVTATVGLGLMGFVAGALGVGYLDSRRRRLVHTADVASTMRLRALGALPLVPGLEEAPLAEVWGSRLGQNGSLLIEAVNDVRAMLLAGTGDRPQQVFMVTSAAQGEGKTTLACLFALSLAQMGKRTLLVDADLRNPQVANRLGLPPVAGLGEVLRGEARPASVIGGVPGTALAVMTAGRACSSVIRGLSMERVALVLNELRRQFDYIVVDTCPTPLADGLVIGACADAAVLVVRSGVSEEAVVREACERMVAARVPLVGGVVNGVVLGRQKLRYPYALPAGTDVPHPTTA